jgi:hypothetical protein
MLKLIKNVRISAIKDQRYTITIRSNDIIRNSWIKYFETIWKEKKN